MKSLVEKNIDYNFQDIEQKVFPNPYVRKAKLGLFQRHLYNRRIPFVEDVWPTSTDYEIVYEATKPIPFNKISKEKPDVDWYEQDSNIRLDYFPVIVLDIDVVKGEEVNIEDKLDFVVGMFDYMKYPYKINTAVDDPSYYNRPFATYGSRSGRGIHMWFECDYFLSVLLAMHGGRYTGIKIPGFDKFSVDVLSMGSVIIPMEKKSKFTEQLQQNAVPKIMPHRNIYRILKDTKVWSPKMFKLFEESKNV